NHDYQYEMGEVLEALSRRLVEAIAEWIGGVPIPNPGHLPLLLRVEPDARFISFNYTSTLEKLYGVDPRRVLYIHGSSESGGGPIVLGHGWKQESVGHSDEWDEELRERDPRVQEGEQIIQRYFQDTLKPTAAIIEQNQAFFDSLAGVGEVYVLGHALSPVDLPYFKSIVDATRGAPPRWLVSYHSPSEKESHTEALRSIGVEGDRLDLHPIRKFIRTSCADGVIEGDLSTLWNG
ncbi:MAG: bacteriophage abortive infection AbiH family protein, partial [Rhodothermales bacterium]